MKSLIWIAAVVLCMSCGNSPRESTVQAGGSSKANSASRTNPVDGAEIIYVPAGDFKMGDDDLWEIKSALNRLHPDFSQLKDDNPRHAVTVSGFWMYKNLVTVAQYKAFCAATGRTMPNPPHGETVSIGGISASSDSFNPNWSKGDHPIVNVTWTDAMAYAEWAKADLPTEVEWEKAARGTDGRKYPWGDEFDASKLWCSENPGYSETPRDGTVHVVYPGTHKVGQLGVSPYGITDMAGNVDQWCKDWYSADYWKSDHGIDPPGPDKGTERVVRGSSWTQTSPSVRNLIYRTSYRRMAGPTWGPRDDQGFRCVVRGSK